MNTEQTKKIGTTMTHSAAATTRVDYKMGVSHPPNHPPTRIHHLHKHRSTKTKQYACPDYGHEGFCCCIVQGLPCFYDPPPYRGSGTAHFDARFDRGTSSLVGARSFADKTYRYVRVGRAWRGRAAAGGRVALGRAVPKRGILTPPQM